jgi:hypothetical protein
MRLRYVEWPYDAARMAYFSITQGVTVGVSEVIVGAVWQREMGRARAVYVLDSIATEKKGIAKRQDRNR